MKISVVGAGAVGGLLAYRLARSGHAVSLVARGAHLRAIQRNGLALVSAGQELITSAVQVAASERTEDIARTAGQQDIVVVTLKSYDVAAMLPGIACLLGDNSVVIAAMNGFPWWYFHGICTPLNSQGEAYFVNAIDPQGQMLQDLSVSRVLGCVLHLSAEVREPGVVRHSGGMRLVLGEPSGVLSARLALSAAAFEDAGFNVERSANIRREVWWKLLGNLSFNPVAAMQGKRMHEIVNDEAVLAIIRPMIAEGMQVSAALGVPFDSTPDQRIDIARELGQARISMHQDLLAGRRLEISALTGAVLDIADALAIPVPRIRAIHGAISALARATGQLG
jgi:2-dehydropantoate 2-reductase